MLTQIQELVRRVNEALDKPWANRVGRPKILGLYKAVEVSCQYSRQNETQEVIGVMQYRSRVQASWACASDRCRPRAATTAGSLHDATFA